MNQQYLFSSVLFGIVGGEFIYLGIQLLRKRGSHYELLKQKTDDEEAAAKWSKTGGILDILLGIFGFIAGTAYLILENRVLILVLFCPELVILILLLVLSKKALGKVFL